MKLLKEQSYFLILRGFIIIQPIIDIVTYFVVEMMDVPITLGIVIRTIFMLISLFYIVWGNHHPYRKIVIGYLATLFLIFTVHLVISYLFKPVFHLFTEGQWIVRITYFLVMIAALFLVLHSSSMHKRKEKILQGIYISMTITSCSILFALLTNTASHTYEWILSGYKGWFFSGNELGAIFSICFPLVLIFTLQKSIASKHLFYWLPPLLLGFCGFLLGTKVGFFSIIISLLLCLIALILHRFSKKTKRRLLFPVIAMIGILVIYSPFSPAIKNLSSERPIPEKILGVDEEQTASDVEQDNNDKKDQTKKQKIENSSNKPIQSGQTEVEEDSKKQELPRLLRSEFMNKILSSRHFYVTRHYVQFSEANIFQKLFGMGYSGNYLDLKKTIEMDVLDIFFSFGFIGSLFVFTPFFFLIFILFQRIRKRIKFFFQIENVLLLTSLCLGIGVSTIAGHVFFAPAVSFYLAITISLTMHRFLQKDLT